MSINETTNYIFKNNTIRIKTKENILQLSAVTPSSIHVKYTGRESFSNKESLMRVENDLCEPNCSVCETKKSLIFNTCKLKVEVDKKTLAFIWKDADGKLLVREPSRGGKYLVETPVYKAFYNEESKVLETSGVDGIQTRAEPSGYRKDRMGYSTKLELVFDDEEAIYGLGQGNEGIFNLRGKYRYIYQQNMNIACPMFISTKGYGFLLESYSLGVFHDDESGTYYWAEVEDEMDFYFMYGPMFDDVIAEYRLLTGQSPLLPKWAYGYLQSKERYKNQQELLDIVQEYRKREIPIDCIIQDWRYWGGEYWGEKSFDSSRYPDPKKLMDYLHQLNTKLMISIWPNMRGNGVNQKQLVENGCMFDNNSTYNPFLKKAREIYWEQCYNGIFKYGIDAWWCDCSEPFEADWHGVTKRPPYHHMLECTNEAKKYMDPEFINVFSLKHSQAVYEGQRNLSNKRVVNLTRSHFPGQQRYSTISWSGDISASWDEMRKQIADGLNFTATGAPKWTLDIGGFFVGGTDDEWDKIGPNYNTWFINGSYPGGCNDLGYRELYVRWLQYGVFLPMFRSHGTHISREVWNFGEKGEMFYDILVKYINLRYRLMPYIYSLAGWETHRSYTMMRNLAFDFSHDKNVYNIADQFMFGPSIMVCPVTFPTYYKKDSQKLVDVPKSRQVYLPSGSDWYDFWTGEKIEGGQKVIADAFLDTIPIFVKAGSIIPMGPFIQYADEKSDDVWELRIYPGADGNFDIYEDKGDGYEYEKGEFAWTPVSWNDLQMCLAMGKRKGKFSQMTDTRECHIIKVGPGYGTGIECCKNGFMSINYSGNRIEQYLCEL